MLDKSIIGIDAKNGKLLWKSDRKLSYNTDPAKAKPGKERRSGGNIQNVDTEATHMSPTPSKPTTEMYNHINVFRNA